MMKNKSNQKVILYLVMYTFIYFTIDYLFCKYIFKNDIIMIVATIIWFPISVYIMSKYFNQFGDNDFL